VKPLALLVQFPASEPESELLSELVRLPIARLIAIR